MGEKIFVGLFTRDEGADPHLLIRANPRNPRSHLSYRGLRGCTRIRRYKKNGTAEITEG